ncbi:MAG: phosphatase PAP2 family protein [Bacteroidetes bacterium]|nr:MAG: phosphatase PAP2 family protein [Bacteroidota bacterium]
MTWWQSLDVTIFRWINDYSSNALFDLMLPFWREKLVWAPLYLFLVVFIVRNIPWRKAVLFLLGLLLVVGLSDFTSSTLIKKNVQRLRPCNDPVVREVVVLRVPCGSGYSFTSSHATNHFAVAVYLSLLLGSLSPWIRPVLLLWAAGVAYAQVYVGVHYPGDVAAGALLGVLIGWGVAWLFRRRNWHPAF